ncbi:uncharacterized protein LOC122645813 [Telopea speciosissima]|uniref:uncharacterized protein LOC122645813 n=1 Tax=Telopea speciosissima TaxID=54955 RepID=UPI001CC749C7|nr:uncharacterized protein LOC122645813 [Telopea speciosissima]
MSSTESAEPVASMEVNEAPMSIDHQQRDEAPNDQIDAAQEQPIHPSPKDTDRVQQSGTGMDFAVMHGAAEEEKKTVVLTNSNEAPIPTDTQLSSADGYHPSGVLSESHTTPVEVAIDNGDALSSSIGAKGTKMMDGQSDQIADGSSNSFEVSQEGVHMMPQLQCSTLESEAPVEDHNAVTEAEKTDGVIFNPDEGFQEMTNDGNGDLKLVPGSEDSVVNSDGGDLNHKPAETVATLNNTEQATAN